MKAAACSCLLTISLIEEVRKLSTTSRFSSPGTLKMRSTPSFSSAATIRSDALGMMLLRLFRRGRIAEGDGRGPATLRFAMRGGFGRVAVFADQSV